MKKYIFIIMIIFCAAFNTQAQETYIIEESELQISMPSVEWTLSKTQSSDDKEIYFFKRTQIIDTTGRNVIPNISIIKENIDDLDVVAYSALMRANMPFNVIEVFIPKDIKMPYKNGICYKGEYFDQVGKHTVYVVFLKNGEIGLRVICDVTEELFNKVEPEFILALQSISENK